MLNAFCRSAQAVRLIARTTVLTGDLLLEWVLSSRSSCFVHARRVARFFFFWPRETIRAPLFYFRLNSTLVNHYHGRATVRH